MTSLLSSLTGLLTPDLRSRLASTLGETEEHVDRGVTAGFGSILAGLAGRADDTSFLGRLFDLLPGDDDAARMADPSSLFTDDPTPSGGAGASFLTMLTGGHEDRVADGIGQAAGMSGGAARRLLGMLAPLALGYITRRVRQGGLSASGFGDLLRSERSEIMGAAPGGLASLLGLGGAAAAAPTVTHAAPEPVRPAVTTTAPARPAPTPPPVHDEPRRGMGWLWPLLGLLVLGGIAWALTRDDDDTVRDTSVAGDTTTVVAADPAMAGDGDEAVAGSAVGSAPDTTFGDLGASVARSLPGGATLNVPERGVEGQVIDFVEDAGRPVDETTWFNFDRLLFATGSATLEPQSQEQLRNVSQIMAAFPDVRIKIGGYTDNQGNADSNLRLSQERADAVMRELTTLGVAAERMEAEGYGQEHPVGDNATEEGRQQNRRIAMRVTQK